MDWIVSGLISTLGVAVVVIGGYDVFHTLLNPSGRGTISRLIFTVSWRATRRARRLGVAVGPAAVVVVIAIWAGMQVVGWALIYTPHIPESFAYSHSIDPARFVAFWEAVYFSGATLTTLGFGDTVPVEAWLRVLVPGEALAGFALLSASATWFLQLHGALARRRSLALRLSQLQEAGFADSLAEAPRPSAAVIIESIAEQIAVARVDYVQSTETYYFRDLDERASLSSALHAAWGIAESALASPDAEVRQSGAILDAALRDLAQYLHGAFLGARRSPAPTAPEVFESYVADHHRHQRRRSGTRRRDVSAGE